VIRGENRRTSCTIPDTEFEALVYLADRLQLLFPERPLVAGIKGHRCNRSGSGTADPTLAVQRAIPALICVIAALVAWTYRLSVPGSPAHLRDTASIGNARVFLASP